MPLETHPFPGLFGGVSQQIPAMRHPTQCSAQENGISTMLDGLYKRPGVKFVSCLPFTGPSGGTLAGSGGIAFGHSVDRGDLGGRYELLIVNGSLCLYGIDGTVQNVVAPSGYAYLTSGAPIDDFRAITVADSTFIVNRSIKPAMLPATTAAAVTNVAYISVRTAVVSTTYAVTINGVQVNYTTGTSGVNNGVIAGGLRDALAAALPGYTVYVLLNTNIVKVTKVGTPIGCSVSDSWSNDCLRSLTSGVAKYSDLPPVFETGYVVTITGSADSTASAYYVQWDGTKWVETLQPGAQYQIDPATMPWLLKPTVSGWTFGPATWVDRKVGSNTTVPLPSFVTGKYIRNVFFYRNRLGFLAGDSLIMSRTGSYFNFFASSATQGLASDPIDLGSPSENVMSLESTTPFNENLLVWGTDKQQFILQGGDILTPDNARLKPTTTYETHYLTPPVAVGNAVVCASTLNESARVSLYRLAPDLRSNQMEDISDHVPTYIPAYPRQLSVGAAAQMIVVVPRNASNELLLFKYELDAQDRLSQKCWSKIILGTSDPVRVINTHWIARRLYMTLWMASPADSAGGRYVMAFLNVDEKFADAGIPVAARLDFRTSAPTRTFDGTNTTVDVPYIVGAGQLTYLQCVTGLEPVVLTPISETPDTANVRTRAVFAGNLSSTQLWVGRPYTFRYTFTEPLLRDTNSVPIQSAAVKLVRIIVRYVTTGWFKALVTPLLRAQSTYPMDGRITGRPYQGATQVAASTGDFPIPVHTRAADSVVTIESDSYMPVKLPYAEWVGDITYKAARR